MGTVKFSTVDPNMPCPKFKTFQDVFLLTIAVPYSICQVGIPLNRPSDLKQKELEAIARSARLVGAAVIFQDFKQDCCATGCWQWGWPGGGGVKSAWTAACET